MGKILGVFCLAGLRFFLGVFFLGEEQLHILLCFFQFLHFIPCLTVGWVSGFFLGQQLCELRIQLLDLRQFL